MGGEVKLERGGGAQHTVCRFGENTADGQLPQRYLGEIPIVVAAYPGQLLCNGYYNHPCGMLVPM